MEAKKDELLPAKIKWMQRFFSIAGNIAPKTMLPVMVKLLFTPQRHPLKPPHIECLKHAKKFSFKVTAFRQPGKKVKLACYSWGEGNKTILLVHGWDAKAIDYYKMIPALTEAGYKVVAFDGPGHGQSEGDSSNLVDFKEILPEIVEHIGTPYAIIGHSMGGGATAYMLMETEIKVKRLVLLAIPIISRYFMDESFKFMKIPAKMQRAFFKSMNEKFGESIDRYNLAERTEKIKAEKTLLVYEEHDEEVPVEHIQLFLEKRPEVEPFMVSGVGHNKVQRHPEVIKKVLTFLG